MNKIFTLFFFLITVSLSAQKADFSDVQTIAKNFFYEHNQNVNDIYLTYLKEQSSSVKGTDTLFYVFNCGNEAYLIVSGVYSMSPVLAWSDEGAFHADQINPALELWLRMFAETAAAALNVESKCRNPEWDYYLGNSSSLKDNSKGVSPLITAMWNQNTYYNYHCPEHPNGPGGHCYAGCVATAMSMIMYYHGYPDHGQGSHSYYHPYYTTISADFANATYDWASMTNVINSLSKEAISLLMFHCGVAVDMYYTPTGSSATTTSAAFAFQHYFNYRGTLSVKNKNSYSIHEWRFILNNELEENRPIFYSGYGDGGGHAFVCDGYSDTLYHFNWGWGGVNNGYFNIDDMAFNLGQTAIVGIAPETADYCMNHRVFNDTARTFSDGSNASYYWNNTDCSWLIQPSNGPIVLTFTMFNTEEGKDIVRVYDGTDETGQLLGEFSGTTMPPVLVAESGSMYITFITDSINQGHGWSAAYTSGLNGLDDKILTDAVYYPNPAGNELNIQTVNADEILQKVYIYNTDGKLAELQSEPGNGKIDLTYLPPGIYIVVTITDKHNYIGRILKD